MAKRFTDTELWDKEWFMKLPSKLKCLVKMVRDKSDLCGVWSPNWAIAKTYLNEDVAEEDLLSIDGGRQFKKISKGKIFCIGFIEFQYGELKEKSPVHRKIIAMLKQHGVWDDFLLHSTKYPIEHPINTPQEEEEDKEEEDFGKSENLLNGDALVPRMARVWYDLMPGYTKDQDFDFMALGDIVRFMKNQHDFDVGNKDDADTAVATFRRIAELIKTDGFWSNKPLRSIAKNIQEFYNKIKNGTGKKTAKQPTGGDIPMSSIAQRIAAMPDR